MPGSAITAILQVKEEINTTVEEWVRDTARDVFTMIIDGTPVRTGRPANNWQVGIGNDTSNETHDESWYTGDLYFDEQGNIDEALGEAYSNGESKIATYQIESGQSIYIYNNVPYILNIEYSGWLLTGPYQPVAKALLSAETAGQLTRL